MVAQFGPRHSEVYEKSGYWLPTWRRQFLIASSAGVLGDGAFTLFPDDASRGLCQQSHRVFWEEMGWMSSTVL